MVPEAPLEETEAGRAVKGDVRPQREGLGWYHADGRTAVCDFEGGVHFIVGAGHGPCRASAPRRRRAGDNRAE